MKSEEREREREREREDERKKMRTSCGSGRKDSRSMLLNPILLRSLRSTRQATGSLFTTKHSTMSLRKLKTMKTMW